MIGNLFPVKNDWEMFLPEKMIGNLFPVKNDRQTQNGLESAIYIYLSSFVL